MEVLMKSSAVAISLVAVTVIGIGSIIFNFSNNIVTDSLENMENEDYISSTLNAEAEEFNSQFVPYEGTIKGTKVIELLDILYSNAILNKDYEERLPDIFYEATVNSTGIDIVSTVGNRNDDDMKTAKEEIEKTHNYFITFKKSSIGLIEQINIYYSRPIYGEY